MSLETTTVPREKEGALTDLCVDDKLDFEHHETLTSPVLPDAIAEDGPLEGPDYLTGSKLWLALLGMMLGELVTGLGGNMISPAFGIIVNAFDAAESFGWVGSAFFMAQAPCMLLYGQLLSVYNGKTLLMFAICFFGLGSVVCGSAKSINAVIVGRALSGIGAAGIWVSVLCLVASVAPLRQRPKILGIFGIINAFSAGVGPVLAGYFADSVTWRLCFLFTLPVSVVSLVVIWFTIPAHSVSRTPQFEIIDERWSRVFKSEPKQNSTLYKLMAIDWLGFVLVSAAIICLQLAIQWGGTTYGWTSGTILGLVIGGFAGFMGLFVAWENHLGRAALMPTSLYRERTQWGACLLSMVTLYSNLIGVIMLPYFFEIVLGHSALKAGYEILPYLLTTIMFSLISGLVTTKTGYYWQWLILGPICIIVTGALYMTIQPTASTSILYGYQIIFAAGVGFTQQQIYISVQAASKQEDVHLRIAAVSFAELFGGAIAPTISITILNNKLPELLAKYAPSAPATIMHNTSIINTLPSAVREGVVKAYAYALHSVFLQLVPLGGIMIITTIVAVKNINLKKNEMGIAAH